VLPVGETSTAVLGITPVSVGEGIGPFVAVGIEVAVCVADGTTGGTFVGDGVDVFVGDGGMGGGLVLVGAGMAVLVVVGGWNVGAVVAVAVLVAEGTTVLVGAVPDPPSW